MKKLLVVFLLISICLCSCMVEPDNTNSDIGNTSTNSNSNASTQNSGNTSNPNPTNNTESPSIIEPELISRELVDLGTDTAVIEGVTYDVHNYAFVLASGKYFYDYYRYYYLDGKLKRIDVWNHEVGSCLLYPYDSFTEHKCGVASTKNSYIYYDNGILEFNTLCYISSQKDELEWNISSVRHFYESGLADYYDYYNEHGDLYYRYKYCPSPELNSCTEEIIIYNAGAKQTTHFTYYNDKQKRTETVYTNDVPSFQYSFYPNGNRESIVEYDNGNLKYVDIYDGNQNKIIARINFSVDGISTWVIYYDSGNQHYAYNCVSLYTYDDKWNSGYTEYELYSQDQAKSFLMTYLTDNNFLSDNIKEFFNN